MPMYRLMNLFLRAAAYEERVLRALLYGIHLLKQPHQVLSLGLVLAMVRFVFRKATGTLRPLSLTGMPRSMQELQAGHPEPAAPITAPARPVALPKLDSSARLRIAAPPS
jgi:hypothetical protein